MSAMSAPGRQAALAEGWERRQDAAEADDGPEPLRDDRVVTEATACACGRPAGADGLCYACRREHAGHVIGNGGRL